MDLKKKVLPHQFLTPWTLWVPGFPSSEVARCFCQRTAQADAEAGKGRWPSPHTLRLDEIPLQQVSGEEGRVALLLHMFFILSMTVLLGQR